jgi:hypothetical protein
VVCWVTAITEARFTTTTKIVGHMEVNEIKGVEPQSLQQESSRHEYLQSNGDTLSSAHSHLVPFSPPP